MRKLVSIAVLAALLPAVVAFMLIEAEKSVREESFRVACDRGIAVLSTIRDAVVHLTDDLERDARFLALLSATLSPEDFRVRLKEFWDSAHSGLRLLAWGDFVLPPGKAEQAASVRRALGSGGPLILESPRGAFLLAAASSVPDRPPVVLAADPAAMLRETFLGFPLSDFSSIVLTDGSGSFVLPLISGTPVPSDLPAGLATSSFSPVTLAGERYYAAVLPLPLSSSRYRLLGLKSEEEMIGAVARHQRILLPPVIVLMLVFALGLTALFYARLTREKLHRERALRKETEETKDLLHNILRSSSHFGIVAIDRNYRILHVNPAAARMFDLGEEPLPGMDVIEIHTRRGIPREMVLDRIHQLKAGEKVEFDLEVGRRSGKTARVLSITMMKMLGKHGEELGFLLIARDVTRERESRRLQEELERKTREAEKMEAAARLAGGIAHDFNNILTGLLGYVSILKRHTSGDSPAALAVEKVETAARRAAEQLRKLLGFARMGRYRSEPVDVHELLSRCASDLPENVKLKMELVASRSVVLGDADRLATVCSNLVRNSLEAMPDGGTLSISTSDLPPEDDSSPPFIRITVTDTGEGIPLEILDHVFEPFFSTRARGRGLGLASVYGIVKNHGGDVRISSRQGEGTTVEVLLPVRTEAEPEPSGPQPSDNGSASSEHAVLVVDDEEAVRSSMCLLLKDLGFKALSAASGEEAVKLFRRSPSRFGLVILDMVMPDMDGVECLRRLKEISPDVKVLLMSGFSVEESLEEARRQGAVGFLQKPFSAAELMAEIQRFFS